MAKRKQEIEAIQEQPPMTPEEVMQWNAFAGQWNKFVEKAKKTPHTLRLTMEGNNLKIAMPPEGADMRTLQLYNLCGMVSPDAAYMMLNSILNLGKEADLNAMVAIATEMQP